MTNLHNEHRHEIRIAVTLHVDHKNQNNTKVITLIKRNIRTTKTQSEKK